jgi:hypothetical protein
MRTHKLVEMIKTLAREKEERRLEEARVRGSHHSTKYRRTIQARNHPASVRLAETESDQKKKNKNKRIKSSDEMDHSPDVIDTSPTLNTIAQSR